MIRPHGVDPYDELRVVRKADIRDPLLEAGACGDADEEEKLTVGGAQPQAGDEAGEKDGADGVDPPIEEGAAEGGEETKGIDDDVVAVVLPENADLRVGVPQAPAVEKEDGFHYAGYSDCNRGGKVKFLELKGWAL